MAGVHGSCRVSRRRLAWCALTVPRRSHGTLSAAQQSAWRSAIESAWTNIFKLCRAVVLSRRLQENRGRHRVRDGAKLSIRWSRPEPATRSTWACGCRGQRWTSGTSLGTLERSTSTSPSTASRGCRTTAGRRDHEQSCETPVARHYELIRTRAQALRGGACSTEAVGNPCWRTWSRFRAYLAVEPTRRGDPRSFAPTAAHRERRPYAGSDRSAPLSVAVVSRSRSLTAPGNLVPLPPPPVPRAPEPPVRLAPKQQYGFSFPRFVPGWIEPGFHRCTRPLHRERRDGRLGLAANPLARNGKERRHRHSPSQERESGWLLITDPRPRGHRRAEAPRPARRRRIGRFLHGARPQAWATPQMPRRLRK